MLFEHMKPYLKQVSDNQQRIIRELYDQRLTRPYIACRMGINPHQVLIEEVAALRVIIELMAADLGNKKKTGPKAALGKQMKREAAGPSRLDS